MEEQMYRDDRGLLRLCSAMDGHCCSSVAWYLFLPAGHPIVGYNNLLHLAPAILGVGMFIAGLVLCWKPMIAATPEHVGGLHNPGTDEGRRIR